MRLRDLAVELFRTTKVGGLAGGLPSTGKGDGWVDGWVVRVLSQKGGTLGAGVRGRARSASWIAHWERSVAQWISQTDAAWQMYIMMV